MSQMTLKFCTCLMIIASAAFCCTGGDRDHPAPAAGSFALRIVKAITCCPVLVVKVNSKGPYLRSDSTAMGEWLENVAGRCWWVVWWSLIAWSFNLSSAKMQHRAPAAGSFALRIVKAITCCPVLVVKVNSQGPYLRSDSMARGE